MKKTKLDGLKGVLRTLSAAVELLMLAFVYYYIWRNGYEPGVFPAYLGNGKYILAGVYAALAAVLIVNFEGFRFGYLRMIDIIVSQIIALFIGNFITYWQLCLIANKVISVVPMLCLMAVDVAIIFVCSVAYNALYHHIYMPKNMVMIFGSQNAVGLKFKMDTRTDKYKITKLLPADLGYDAICKEIIHYDAVILNDIQAELRNELVKFCYQNSLRLYVAPKLTDIVLRGAANICLFDTPLPLVRSKGLNSFQRFAKRLLDIVLCLIAMVVALPIMAVVAIAIKCEDGGPVFYRQDRVTLNGKVFSILKFRSMIVNAEKNGISQPATDRDPRITKVGRVIRATRIDELPQILNILKGDMSIVGPRPERVEHVEKYTAEIPEFAYRLKVKGGLTGYAQIYGKYNTTAYDKLRLDLMYVENYSFLLDIKLILMTIRIMLSKESTEGFDEAALAEKIREEMLKSGLPVDDEREEAGSY